MTEITGSLTVDIRVIVPAPEDAPLWYQRGKACRPISVAFKYFGSGAEPLRRWSMPGIEVHNIRKDGSDGARAYRHIFSGEEPPWLAAAEAAADQYVHDTWPWLGPTGGEDDGDS